MKSQEFYQKYLTADAEYNAIGDTLSSYDTAVQDANDAYAAAQRNADAAIQTAQDAVNAEKFSSDDSIQTQLDRLQEKIDKCTVKAPKSGIVTSIDAAEGSIPTKESIMTIEDASKLRIKVQIKENDILNVKEGQKAVITTTATGNEEFAGTVERVVTIMSSSGTNMYTGAENTGYSAEIAVDDPDGKLLIGMSAKVKIILEEKDDALAVPYSAISEEKDGTFTVVVAEENGDTHTAKKVKVEKGLDTSYLTEVTSSELKEGDIILTDPSYITDGQTLNISGSYYDSGDGE